MNELRNAVNALKDVEPKEIAQMLKDRRIKGRPGTTGRCPLAIMLHNEHGSAFIVGPKLIMRRSGSHGDQVEKMKTPANLAAFVRMFDKGEFPELIQVPPRCRADFPPKSKGGPGKKRRPKINGVRIYLSREVGRAIAHGG